MYAQVIFAPWIALLALLPLSACAPSSPDVDPVQLAADIQISLGGNQVIVPVVAVAKRTEEDVLTIPKSQTDTLEIRIEVYGSAAEMLKSREICPLLTRQWSRSMCMNAYSPINRSLPRSFTLLTEAGLSWLSSVSSEFDVVSPINFDVARPGRGCTTPRPSQTQLCWAGYQLSNGLIVLWSSSPEDDVKFAEMIQIFVDNALGSTENFDLLERAAVKRRRSDAGCIEGQPYTAEAMERVRTFEGVAQCNAL